MDELIFASCLGVPLVVGLISEPLGFYKMYETLWLVLFDEWFGVLGLWSVRLLDDTSAGRVMTAW